VICPNRPSGLAGDQRLPRFPEDPEKGCIIHGALDEFFPVRIAERMAEALPDCRLYVIPRQSHALIFRQPWTVLARMLAFYDRRTVGEKANIP